MAMLVYRSVICLICSRTCGQNALIDKVYYTRVVVSHFFECSTRKLGEMIQFDEHIFSNGLLQPPTIDTHVLSFR